MSENVLCDTDLQCHVGDPQSSAHERELIWWQENIYTFPGFLRQLFIKCDLIITKVSDLDKQNMLKLITHKQF